MAAGIELLTSVNITRVARFIEDVQTLPQPLKFYERAAKPQTNDEEITMRQRSFVFAADIVSTDSKALTREAGDFQFETTKIAKIKHGFGVTESYVQLLNRIENAQASAADAFSFDGYIARETANLLLGIKQRIESMIVGMLLDGYVYDRLGIKLSGTWGMPAAYKFNPLVTWDDEDATPITDLITLKSYALRIHGEIFNRITMSTAAIENIVKTKQFKEQVKITNYKWDIPDSAIITVDANQFAGFIGSLAGMVVEVYDGMYREYQSNGSIATPIRFLPENVILLTNSGDDNSAGGWDFAQGQIMESYIGRLGGTSVIGGNIQEGYGPIAYATQANPGLNPPGLNVWAVDRGAPRKHRPTCSAKINAWG